MTGNGTRDLCGPTGLTTEQFVEHIAASLEDRVVEPEPVKKVVPVPVVRWCRGSQLLARSGMC